MKKIAAPFIFIFLILSSGNFLFAQTADHLLISEILIDGVNESSSSNNDEFVEIYNPTSESVDVSSWTIDYRSASGTSFNTKYTFPSGTVIQSHRYFLFGGGGVENRDNSSESLLLGLGNSGGGVFLRNLSGVTIDLIGWGSAVEGNFEGSVASKPAQGVSLERKAFSTSNDSSMGVGGSDEFEGNGFDSDNNANDFIQRTTPQPQNSLSPAEPKINNNGNGTGNASVFPNNLNASELTNLAFTIAGDGVNILDSVLIIIPSSDGWVWSGNLSDIEISGNAAASPVVNILSDTIYTGSISVTSTDSLIIKVKNITAPGINGYTDFIIKTAVSGGIPEPIYPLPRVNILKLIPIIEIHVNDADGVPASPYGLGATVTISGIITADYNSTRTDIYVQDATAGIDIYDPSRFFNYQVGDSVTITGTIIQFRGLTEISPDSSLFFIHTHNNKIPEPMLLTAAEVNQTFNKENYTEPNEGRLVRLNDITYNPSDQTISDATGATGGYFGSLEVPSGTFDLIGILKQYKPGTTVTTPYTSDYEVNPRSQGDIIISSGPGYLSKPVEENIRPDSITISFKTTVPSRAIIKYGKTIVYSDSVVDSEMNTEHAVLLSDLYPATVYHYQVGIMDTSGTNYTGDNIFSTASPYGSTGAINIYFNHSVDTTVSIGENAQSVNIYQKFIQRINNAKYSIDVALYSLSGTVGANVASALIAAQNQGVKVRVIGEYDNDYTVPWTTLSNAGVPLIFDNFDPINAGSGLMHNKFAVFDFRDTSSFTDDWVWSGSWNATDPGNNNDAQNVVEIQDKSLANAYTIEFNEMWGSDTDTPNSSNSKFGIRKTNNTPHLFNIAGIPIELYFDPSDQTTSHISGILNSAQYSIDVNMLTFTRDDLAQVLVNKENTGEKVRVILDNNTDTGNEYSYLQNNGIDIHLKGGTITGLLHHKYAVIDAEDASVNSVVITGSHNWSTAAETANNENTLIIHSKNIANLFLQEFKSRYIEAGGTGNIVITGIKQRSNKAPDRFYLYQNYPNPFNPSTSISFSIPRESFVTLKIFNILGQKIKTLVDKRETAGSYKVNFNAAGLSSGIYFYSIEAVSKGGGAGNYYSVKKMIYLK